MELTTNDKKALQGAVRVLVEILQQSPPEVPDTINQWPTDDKHLQGEFWEDTDGDIYRFSNGHWEVWQLATRRWWKVLECPDDQWAPFTRTTDPSAPRPWDSLDAVEADVERVTGDYEGTRRELARSPLSESGWFQRGPFGGWVELSADRTRRVTNIKEETK